MIVEIKIIFIGTTKITPKNWSELVFFGCVDRKRPVLGGPVQSPQYLGRSWTGCGPRLRVLGAKNRTEPDLKTLFALKVGTLPCDVLMEWRNCGQGPMWTESEGGSVVKESMSQVLGPMNRLEPLIEVADRRMDSGGR
jgi:hypothetical protein